MLPSEFTITFLLGCDSHTTTQWDIFLSKLPCPKSNAKTAVKIKNSRRKRIFEVTSIQMTKPIMKILEGPTPTQEGVSQVVTIGTASLLSAFSKAVDLFPHDAEGLIQLLHFRNQVAKVAQCRSRWIGGRLYNKLSGEDPDYIPLSGTHISQAFSAAGIEPPDFIVASGKYLLRLDISTEAVNNLSLKQGK